MKVIICKGLPGSGKSTWAKKYCEKNPDWVRVNRDDLRNMRGRYWIPKQENMISDWEHEIIVTALEHKKNVIVDATNFNQNHVNSIKDICGLVGNVEFETKFFNVSLEDCIKRDLARPNSVGEKVIRGMYNKYLKPDRTVKQNKDLPRAIICDLDGTLAIHNGRTPFEYHKCDTDLINEVLEEIIFKYTSSDIYLIFLSGREDCCKEKTIDWLANHGFHSFDLHMRKTGDWRKDCIIKEEIFRERILPFYHVEMVFDDRNQVVEMWRDLGLKCFQVAEGDF